MYILSNPEETLKKATNLISTFSSCFYYHHHLELNNQSIKPTVERLSYILHDSSISRDHHLLTITDRCVNLILEVARRGGRCIMQHSFLEQNIIRLVIWNERHETFILSPFVYYAFMLLDSRSIYFILDTSRYRGREFFVY